MNKNSLYYPVMFSHYGYHILTTQKSVHDTSTIQSVKPEVLLVKACYKQLCGIYCQRFHILIYSPKQETSAKAPRYGRYMGKRHREICFSWISLTKRIFIEKSCISFQGSLKHGCVKWELPGCDFSRKHPLAIVCLVNFCRPQCPDFHTWEIKGYQGAFENGGLNVRGDKPVHKILISFAC